MPYRRIPPKQWPARNEVRELARQFTVKATNKLIELVGSKSDFVAVLAARAVLERAEIDPPNREKSRARRAAERKRLGRITVKIKRFREESGDAD